MQDNSSKIPETMRAMVLTGHGGLDKLEHHHDWPIPSPADGEVLVQVGACGLNNTDINTRTAWYSRSVTEGITDSGGTKGFDEAKADNGSWGSASISFPRIQSADVAGRIAGVGKHVDSARICERVLLDPWLLAPGDWMDASRSMWSAVTPSCR